MGFDEPSFLYSTTVLEPTATKISLPYTTEDKLFVTGMVKGVKLLPLSLDNDSHPPLPTVKN